MSSTSVGRGPASGGNENHDGDPRNTTMGETVKQEPPAGAEQIAEAPEKPAVNSGGGAGQGIGKGSPSNPGGPNVEAIPKKPDTAQDRLEPS